MSDVIITPQLQAFIDRATSFPRIIGMTVTTVSSDISLPESVTNPLFFYVTVLNSTLDQSGVAHVILPDFIYNSAGLTVEAYPKLVDQLWPLTFYDDNQYTDYIGLNIDHIVAYWDESNQCIQQILGFEHTLFDMNTAHPQLKSLVSMISTVTNTVNLYKYTDPRVMEKLETTEAYLCYCMFGSTSTTRYLGGADAIGFCITTNDYLTTSTHQLLVNHTVSRIAEYKANK
jgi:hypothetical protein